MFLRIIKRLTIRDYWRSFPEAETPLRKWLEVAKNSRWRSITDVRKSFPHADGAVVRSGNTVTVFNIGGNNYRLVVSIKYKWGMIYVRDFLTHAEYTKESWKGRH